MNNGRLCIAVLAVVVGGGCRFDQSFPATLMVLCNTTAECPNELKCQVSNHQCVPDPDDVAPTIDTSSVEIVGHSDNPLKQPTALGPRSTALVKVTVKESLNEPPTLSVIDGDLDCKSLLTGFTSTWGCEVNAKSASGIMHFEVTLRDVALNESKLLLPETVQVLVGPVLSADGSPGHLLLRDSPWGDAATGGVPSLRLSAVAGTFTGATWAQVLATGTLNDAGADTPVALQLISVTDAGGLPPTELSRVNQIDRYQVVAIDSAGNSSPSVPLRDVKWLASFVGKVSGTDYPNPHRFESIGSSSAGLEGFPVVERGEFTGIALPDDAGSSTFGTATWVHRNSFTDQPESRASMQLSYDYLRSKVVRFGGSFRLGTTLTGTSDSSWEWNGHDWLKVVPQDPESDGNPVGRVNASLLWDRTRKSVVLFGGRGLNEYDDSWAYDGVSWKQLAKGPPARSLAVAFADPVSGQPIIAGGFAKGVLLKDSWQLGSKWSQLSVNTKVPFRGGAAVATDALTGDVWIFGGSTGSGLLGDLWHASSDSAFSQVDGGLGPSPRWKAASAWDTTRNTLVLYGGELPDAGVSAELWEFNGTSWSQPTTSGGPGPRSQHQLVYDPARKVVVLCGSNDDLGQKPDETWEWDGVHWRLGSMLGVVPDSVTSTNLVWNQSSQRLGTVGTLGGVSAYAELSAAGWVLAANVPTMLPVNDAHLGYDQQRDRLLLVNGMTTTSATQLWSYAPDAGWVLESSDIGAKSNDVAGFADNGLTMGVVHRKVNNSFWLSRLGPSGLGLPSRDLGVSLLRPTVTTGADRLAALVGQDVLTQPAHLYFFDPNGQVTAGQDFATSFRPNQPVWDSAIQSLIMPGARTDLGATVPALVYSDGWVSLPIADPDNDGEPSLGKNDLAVGFDQQREVSVIVDRTDQSVWDLSVAHERPQVNLRFALAPLPNHAEINAVRLRLTAGGKGRRGLADGGGFLPVNGVRVFARSVGAWVDANRPLTASADGPLETAVIEYVTPDSIRALTVGSKEIDFALRTIGENGNSNNFAHLVVDAAELELDYRLP